MPVSTEHDLQARDLLEHAGADHRQHLHRHRVAVPDVHLEVVRGPARRRGASRCRRCAARPAGPPRRRRAGSASSGGCPGPAPRRRAAAPARSGRRRRRRSISAHGELGVLVRRADRAEQPRLPVEPLLARSSRSARGTARRRAPGASLPEVLRLHRRQDRVVHVVLVEQLLLDEPEVASPGSPLRAARRRGSRRCACAGTSRRRPRRAGRTPRGGAATRALRRACSERGHHRRVHVAVDERDRALVPAAPRSLTWTSVMRAPPSTLRLHVDHDVVLLDVDREGLRHVGPGLRPAARAARGSGRPPRRARTSSSASPRSTETS